MSETSGISVDPLTPRIGAEISGVDLTRPLSDAQVDGIRRAWLKHQVVFFRDQPMEVEQHVAFGKRFGELHIHPAAPKPVEGHPEILVVHADEKSAYVAGGGWHSDVSCDAEPPMGSILHIHRVPGSGGGDTLFASMYAAYEALSDRMQHLLEDLSAVHSSEHVYKGRYGHSDKKTLRDGDYPSAEHPVVRVHPETGRKAIYVNWGFTTGIVGMKPAESRALLDFLFRHVTREEFQCRFRWRPDSVAFWDNRCTQHLAIWDYYPEVRHGYRVTLKGDRPFGTSTADAGAVRMRRTA
ncbi:MAG TPA: TauD/TfdA family dioxygenase [Gammaproteobacteria bacterium]|nr:TauD/TfdA family dioxygenase [Gammaproteobacteria bacterium]